MNRNNKSLQLSQIDNKQIMINKNSNNDSASTLNKNDMNYDELGSEEHQEKLNQVQPQSVNLRTSNKFSFVNPFTTNNRCSQPSEQQFHFQKKETNPFNNLNRSRLSKATFSNIKESFNFSRKSKTDNQKQFVQPEFEGNLSGSIFSSQKTQAQLQKESKRKNLQTLMTLLKEHYNEGYQKNNFKLTRRSILGTINNSIRCSQVSNFITRQPILFQKKSYGLRSGYDLSGNFLCKSIGNKIYYKNVLIDELQNIEQIKCECIQLSSKQSISPSLQIDSEFMRLFYYSNTTNEIVVLSLSKYRKNSNKEICRIKTRTQRKNPLLYLIQINQQVLLLLIGGYTPFNPKSTSEEVEGCKFIQIFPVDKWGTGIMESRIIKLINGKIYPVVIFPVKIQIEDSLLLVGGNAMAKIVGDKLSFKDFKVVNRSSNVRAVYINMKHIFECIEQGKDIMSLPNGNNISVQIEDKVNLYKGYVDYIKTSHKQKIHLFLPKMRQFYTLKILKKQVRIIRSKENQQRLMTFDSSQEYHHLEMKCFKKPTTKYYEISNKGNFQEKKIQLFNNDTFSMRKQCKCPCEFM